MPDRIIHQRAPLYADLPTTEPVSVIVTNPLNQVIVDNELATQWAEGRYMYTVPVVDMSGVWEVVWDDGASVREAVMFSVGPAHPAEVTRFHLKTQVAAEVDNYHLGRVEDAYGNTLVDPTVLGGPGNYKGWWILVREGGAAIPRRVVEFSGNGFTIAPPFVNEITRGTSYLLTPIPPQEIDSHIRTTLNGLSEIARIEVHVPNIPVDSTGEQNEIPVPRGITHVHNVSIEDTEVPFGDWSMRSGRRLRFSSDTSGEFASIIGTRLAGFPQWEDSTLDFDSETVQARVVALAHSARARGQAQDDDEHLRRHLTAMDAYAMFRRFAAGRPYPGARAVID